MQSCWDSRSCLLEMLQSAEVIATAAPPHAEESVPQSCTLCGVQDGPDKLHQGGREVIVSHRRGWRTCARCPQHDDDLLPCPEWFKTSPPQAACD